MARRRGPARLARRGPEGDLQHELRGYWAARLQDRRQAQVPQGRSRGLDQVPPGQARTSPLNATGRLSLPRRPVRRAGVRHAQEYGPRCRETSASPGAGLMGSELRGMIRDGAPATWTAPMIHVAGEIADDARDPSQGVPGDGGWPWSKLPVEGHFNRHGKWRDGLTERCGMSARAISRALTGL